MVKGKDVIGLKVITINGGREVDDVQDLIYDPSKQRILGLIVDQAGWFNDAQIIRIEDVKSIGEDAVMIESGDSVLKAPDAGDEIADILSASRGLTRTKLITEQGKELGSIDDILFDENTGRVLELIVSEGVVGDLGSGKKRVRVSDIITIGKDATIASSATEYDLDMQDQTSGIKGRLDEAKAESSEMFEEAKQMAKGAFNKAKQKVNEVQASRSEDIDRASDLTEQQAIKARLLAEDKMGDIGGMTKEKGKDLKQVVKKFGSQAKKAARDPEAYAKRTYAEKKQARRSEKSRGERTPG
jgi:uncharacterized protein YrrD